HWFTGSMAEARRAAALGCYYSVNAEMTHSDPGRALVAELPTDRLLTETDAAFTQIDGLPTDPADTHIAILAVASSRNLATHAFTRAFRTSLETLLRAT